MARRGPLAPATPRRSGVIAGLALRFPRDSVLPA
jgi:hypothetical protein